MHGARAGRGAGQRVYTLGAGESIVTLPCWHYRNGVHEKYATWAVQTIGLRQKRPVIDVCCS